MVSGNFLLKDINDNVDFSISSFFGTQLLKATISKAGSSLTFDGKTIKEKNLELAIFKATSFHAPVNLIITSLSGNPLTQLNSNGWRLDQYGSQEFEGRPFPTLIVIYHSSEAVNTTIKIKLTKWELER